MSLLRLKPYKYKNPNKFIIKKNKFIRDFDKLYRQISDPWSKKKNFEYSEQFIFCIHNKPMFQQNYYTLLPQSTFSAERCLGLPSSVNAQR